MSGLKENIDQSLEILYKLEKQSSKKKLLDKPKTIYLQIGLFRIPYVPSPIKKFLKLRHSMYGDEPEICLFVPNRKLKVEYKRTTDEFIDFCVDYYTELLEKHKVKGISTIMPLKQLRSEYGAYELRRKLVRRYDLFLCKNSLLYNPRFLTSLGKIFKDASREPLGISFPKEDSDFDPEFQKNIDRAICTTSFVIKRGSDNYTIPIGSLSSTKAELKENLETVLDQLISENMIPGGLQNVRVMFLWPTQSKPIPLFVNPELPQKEKKPRVRTARKKKMPVGVEGEISTQPGKKVVVMPNGEVFVTPIGNYKEEEVESESEDSFKDDSEDEEEIKKNEKSEKEKKESESEDDEEIEEKEEKLLKAKRKAEEVPKQKNKKSRKAEEESASGESDTEEKKAEEKGNKKKKKKKVNKSNRKSLIKQTSKSKRKKV